MFNFLRSLFSGLPSTASYEAYLQDQENKYATYMETFESDEYKRYIELKEFVYNPANMKFRPTRSAPVQQGYYKEEPQLYRDELKQYKRTFKLEEKQFKREIKQLKEEFNNLKKTRTMKTFFYLKKNYAKSFAEQERWVSKFYDDFAKPELDPRWTDNQVVGEKLLNGAHYSPIEEMQTFTLNNLQQVGGMLKIRVREEHKEGLAWDKTYGLVPRTFNYTSGMVTSANAFKQLYGKFMAKVQVKQTSGTYHAFWLGTETKKPHLNIFKIEGHNLTLALYTNSAKIEKKLKYKLKNDFYIFTLLWSNEKIIWFINGKRVFETTNVISEPMYIALSSGVYDKKASATTMYVDWVKCYRMN